MALNISLLSSEITTGLSQVTPTTETDGFAQGIIEGIQNDGVATTGSPTGTISGVSGSNMATLVEGYASYPSSSSELTGICTAIASHINNDATITYPSSPYLNGGVISNLDGTVLANLIKTEVGYPSVSTELLGFATAIVDHIMTNAICNGGAIF